MTRDLAGWRTDRLPELPETAWISVAPDWICEVLSASTAALDRAGKMPHHARAGVAFAWLVDPVVQTVEVFQLESGRWVLLETVRGDRAVRPPPFDALALDLAPLWRVRSEAR